MSFDIARTPTLQAVATQDEVELSQDLQKRAEGSVQFALTRPEVVEAVQNQQLAEGQLQRLQKAERVLSDRVKDLRSQLAGGRQKAIETIIESAASKGAPNFAKLLDLSKIENQDRHANAAIERIVEHLIPVAQITRLRAESHAMATKARTMERIAQERAEKVLEQLRGAVTEEVVLPIDMSKGVAGALLSQARTLKACSIQLSENADQIERSYLDREGLKDR
jgi:hypothetical protein